VTLFSGLVAQFSGAANALTQAQARVRASNRPLIDLINGNPTQHGLQFPAVILESALQQAQAAATVYHPHPKGQAVAREAISAYYAAQGARFDPEHVLLTPGTSQSYWYLFQLLADPGQEILTPQPSYPLFDYIAALCRVTLTSYPLAHVNRVGCGYRGAGRGDHPKHSRHRADLAPQSHRTCGLRGRGGGAGGVGAGPPSAYHC